MLILHRENGQDVLYLALKDIEKAQCLDIPAS